MLLLLLGAGAFDQDAVVWGYPLLIVIRLFIGDVVVTVLLLPCLMVIDALLLLLLASLVHYIAAAVGARRAQMPGVTMRGAMLAPTRADLITCRSITVRG